MTGLTSKEQAFILDSGRSVALSLKQMEILRGPRPVAQLLRPCTINDGIVRIDQDAWKSCEARHATVAGLGRMASFVPASGAASRMCASLVRAHQEGIATLAELRSRVQAGEASLEPALRALSDIEQLSVWTVLCARAPELVASRNEGRIDGVLREMLEGMALAAWPKGLVPWHGHGAEVRTAVAEHLAEAAAMGTSAEGQLRVHFTVAGRHREAFRAEVNRATPWLRDAGATAVEVTFSEQDPATDTLALDAEGAPFVLESGALLFRPGGHGALLHNLAEFDGDLVLIKNIDNIVPERNRETIVRWRQRLVGVLVELETTTLDWLRRLEGEEDGAAEGAIAFAEMTFGRQAKGAASREVAFELLHRPIRICAMVANDGQPGGGPFWTLSKDGSSPQIVEGAQLNEADEGQRDVWRTSTHFNPVDMACSMRDHHGKPYDLLRYVDDEAWIVTHKTHEGRALTALENPGLWNGSMAGWNTVFVEVPRSTFNPIKTLADLLGPGHQS